MPLKKRKGVQFPAYAVSLMSGAIPLGWLMLIAFPLLLGSPLLARLRGCELCLAGHFEG